MKMDRDAQDQVWAYEQGQQQVRALAMVEYNEAERQRTVVRRRYFQWVWWLGAWLFPLLIVGGLLALWMLRRARLKYSDPAPWLHDARPMLLGYVGPLIVGTLILSLSACGAAKEI